MFGDMRDQVMDKAQNIVSNLTEEAKQVVEEVRPQLQETAQRVVEDLKASGSLSADELLRTGKEAGQQVKQALQDAGSTVATRVEDTTGIKLGAQGGAEGNMQGGEGSQGNQGGQGNEGGSMGGDTSSAAGDRTQAEPNVGGSYDSKFDNKS